MHSSTSGEQHKSISAKLEKYFSHRIAYWKIIFPESTVVITPFVILINICIIQLQELASQPYLPFCELKFSKLETAPPLPPSCLPKPWSTFIIASATPSSVFRNALSAVAGVCNYYYGNFSYTPTMLSSHSVKLLTRNYLFDRDASMLRTFIHMSPL